MEIYTANWLILFPLAFSLFVGMRLSCGSVDDGRRSWTLMAVQALMVNSFVIAGLAFGVTGNWASLTWLFCVAVFAFVFFFKRRRLQRNALYEMCMQVSELQQQQRFMGYLVEENDGWLRRKAGRIQRDLAIGKDWISALETRGIAVGIFERIHLRLFGMYGTSAQATRGDAPNSGTRVSVSPLQIEAEAERMFGRLMMFAWGILVFPIVALVMTFIVPTFKVMFEEFGLSLPKVTQWMIAVADFSANPLVNLLLIGIPALLTACVMIGILAWIFPTVLRLRMFRWLSGDYLKTAGFYTLSKVLSRESEMVTAFQRTAEVLPLPSLSDGYRRAAVGIESGQSVSNALRSSGLLDQRELAVFDKSQEIAGPEDATVDSMSLAQEPVWGLQQYSVYRIERMLNRYSKLVQFAVFALTIFFGVVVAVVAVGLIGALVTMISSLA
ncbi:MAG: hypothetical protein AB8B50_19440 [Pirellulaceae bacterium]